MLHTDQNKLHIFAMGAFHVSELAGQTIPVVMRISLITKLSSQISQVLNNMHKGDGFLANTLEKADFIC